MKIELWEARGLRIAINGIEPKKGGWAVGETKDGAVSLGWDVRESFNTPDEPLHIGDYRLRTVKLDKSVRGIALGAKDTWPTTLTAWFDDGTVVVASITLIASAVYVFTAAGKRELIDEITLYICADTEAAAGTIPRVVFGEESSTSDQGELS
jgi:hypothetical protein